MNEKLTSDELREEQTLRERLTSETYRLDVDQRAKLFTQLEKQSRRQRWLPWLLPSLSGAIAAVVLAAAILIETSKTPEQTTQITRTELGGTAPVGAEKLEVASVPFAESLITDVTIEATPRKLDPILQWNADGRFETQLASARKRLNRIAPETKSEKLMLKSRISALRSNISSLRTRIH